MEAPFPPYRERYLPAMTPARIAALPRKERALVILPTGAVEQHGRHLPVAVDALLGQAWLARALPLLPAAAPCYVAPAVTVGKSNEHTGFPGTLMISKDSLRGVLLAVARQLHAWGFRRLAVLNTHGGNTAVVVTTLREIRAAYGFEADLLANSHAPDVSAQEAAYGMHAGEIETAWLLALAPDYVKMGEAAAEFPARIGDPGQLRPERSAATYAWATRDISESGVIGDATRATAANGERWLAEGAAALARTIAALAPA
jgi:creatinine amidohydrolase